MWAIKVLATLLALAGTAPLQAQTLINPDGYRTLTGDRRGHYIGQTLTVLVVESTSAETDSGTGANSKTGINASITGDSHSHDFGLALGGDTTGGGQTNRHGQIRTNVSVRIIETLPEGLLRVSGEQAVTINDEVQQIRIQGLVRPDDVSYDNTVLSYRLADAHIDIIGDGVVTDSQKQNIVYRALKWLRVL